MSEEEDSPGRVSQKIILIFLLKGVKSKLNSEKLKQQNSEMLKQQNREMLKQPNSEMLKQQSS